MQRLHLPPGRPMFEHRVRIIKSLRMQAVSATFLALPARQHG